MKIIYCQKGEHSKSINFVDNQNTVVGFDVIQETARQDIGYKIVSKFPQEGQVISSDKDLPRSDNAQWLSDYVFDKTFIRFVLIENKGRDFDNGGYVVFKLICQDKYEMFLILWNYHNGYYTHGFSFTINGEERVKGSF